MGKVIKFQKTQTNEEQVHIRLTNALAIDLGEALVDVKQHLTENNSKYPQPYKVWVQTEDATYTWQSRASVYSYDPCTNIVAIVSQHKIEHPSMCCKDLASCLMALEQVNRSYTLTTNKWGTVLDQAKYKKIING